MFILRQQPAMGLDISDYSIEVFQFTRQKKIKALGRVVLKQGIIRDGVILNKEKLTEMIKQAIEQAKIKTHKVIVSMPDSKAFIHIFQMPQNLTDKTLRDAISFEVPKIIPIEQEKVYWDCRALYSIKDTGQQCALYVGVFKEIVNGYLEVLDTLQLEPVAIEIESLAIGRTLLSTVKGQISSAMIVDIGARTTNLSIFDAKGALRLSSTIPIAGNNFTKGIAQELNISIDKAEAMKRNKGLERGTRIRPILKREIQPIVEEIKKICRYWKEDIARIYIVGGSAQMSHIIAYFSTQLDKKVVRGTSSVAKQLPGNSILYNTVIGLALRALERNPELSGINLLPFDKRVKTAILNKRLRENKQFQIFVYIVTALVLIFWMLVTYRHLFLGP